jgi:hypothetical protein
MGVAPSVQHYFWSVGGPGPAKPPGQGAYILEWAKEVSDMPNPPLITSHSYGDTEQGVFGWLARFPLLPNVARALRT